MRSYDTRVARFISVDPITAKYPELTPYQFAGNTPIQAVDLDGLEPAFYSRAFTPEQNQKYSPKAAKIGLLATTVAASVVFTVTTGPVGLVLGPTCVGLSTTKLVGTLAPNTFDQKKIDMLPTTPGGVLVGATVAVSGGNFKTGGLIGDVVFNVATIDVSAPISAIDVASQAATFVDVSTNAVDLMTNSNSNENYVTLPNKSTQNNSVNYNFVTGSSNNEENTQQKAGWSVLMPQDDETDGNSDEE